MGRRFRQWTWGLLPLAIVAVAALALRVPDMPGELAERAHKALAQNDYSWAEVAVSGRDVTLAGTVPDDESLAGAFRVLSGVRGVRHVGNATTKPPVARPYEWWVAHEKGSVTLGGHVPSARLRRQLGEAAGAAFPDKQLNDNMEYARGVPQSVAWAEATELMISVVQRLSEGRAVFRGTDIHLSGRAANPAAHEALPDVLDPPPPGFRLSELSILPARVSPHRFEARMEQGGINLAGHVPSEHAAAFARGEAEDLRPDKQIFEGTIVAEGPVSEGNWIAAARYVFGRLVLLADGGLVSIVDRRIEIDGRAADTQAYEALLAGSNSEPPGFSVSFAIRPPSATLR